MTIIKENGQANYIIDLYFCGSFCFMQSSAIDDVFAKEAVLMALPGGTLLVGSGETVRALYRLTAGRLAEVEQMAQGGGRLVTIHRPVALIAGAQLLGNIYHRTTIAALRDSELEVQIGRRSFYAIGPISWPRWRGPRWST